MKKHYNAFRANHLNNMLRILFFICILAIVLMVVLYFSVAENRKFLVKWFGLKNPNVEQVVNQTNKNDLGINNTVAVNKNIKVRALDRADNLWGPIDAPINLIVYDDFECPFSAQFYDTINKAKAEFGNNLVVAVRHFPLTSHAEAMKAALASECAAEQNKFWEMYKELFEDNKANRLKEEKIIKNSEIINLDTTQFLACLTKEKYKDKILNQKNEVKDLGVIGTPASFLNNQYLSGAVPYEDFTYPDNTPGKGLKTLIQEKLAEIKNK